jgi:outer membrane receptor for ferrienterochelin and colicins
MKCRHLISLLLLILSVSAMAQNDERTVYEKALNAYSIGRFGESLSYLNDVKRSYSIVYRVAMYRLAALCYLANDDEQNARKFIQDMLKVNPYYIATAKDPARFTAMVESLRKSSVTLVTASSESESIEESPVPVVVITAEMIHDSGARNMRELLTLYVPGMTQVETLKQPSVSYHGVYSSEQENILVMIDGHRLNNRSLNSKNFDYGISLQNIKQIEVLRGPASSLYGNVALTGVVNIITKNGGDINAVELSAAVGNFGTQQYTAQIGKRFNDFDVSCWGTVTNIKGERYNIPVSSPVNLGKDANAYSIIGSYASHPSYDFGFSLTYKNFRLQYGRDYSRYVLPMTDNYQNFSPYRVSMPYNHDNFKTFEGEGPGNGVLSNYFDFSYNKEINSRLSVGASVRIDYNEMRGYSPSDSYTTSAYNYSFLLSCWEESTKSLSLLARYKYGLQGLGHGSLLFALQGEITDVGQSNARKVSVDSGAVSLSSVQLMEEGKEKTYSAAFQVKHYFTNSIILNAGARFDYKQRVYHQNYTSIVPRLSLIYLHDTWNAKISFSRSFVDAPYYYRAQRSKFKLGNMNPEYLNSLQFTFDYAPQGSNLKAEANIFYNSLKDGIFRVESLRKTASDTTINNTKLDIIGVEGILRYRFHGFHTNVNITWQRVLSSENGPFTGSRVNNVPVIFGNDIFGYDFSLRKNHHLGVNIITRFSGNQSSPYVINTSKDDAGNSDADYMIPARYIFDAGINYEYRRISCQLYAYNIFDKQYAQGGTTYFPYEQMGRNVIFKIKLSLF